MHNKIFPRRTALSILLMLLCCSCAELIQDRNLEAAQEAPQNTDSEQVLSTMTAPDVEISNEVSELSEETEALADTLVEAEPAIEPALLSSDEMLSSQVEESDVLDTSETVDEPNAEIDEQQLALIEQQRLNVIALCTEIGETLGSVSTAECLSQKLQFGGAYSVNERPLVIRDFAANNDQESKTKVLILGGIHGDEYSSISIMFKWMGAFDNHNSKDFLWRFVPTANPDGLFADQATRQNANGVDLNRNFPSRDWNSLATEYWNHETGSNPRRYPGESAASEPETQWIVEQIETYQPDVIVSVHAPYHLLDFDGPSVAPDKIGGLLLHQLGVYPGSLGNYAGLDLGVPVITLELPSAGIMPSNEEITTMWKDLLEWLQVHELEKAS